MAVVAIVDKLSLADTVPESWLQVKNLDIQGKSLRN